MAGASPTNALGASMGEAFAGDGQSADFFLGIGFWHGSAGCSCPRQGDFDEDGFVTAVDQGLMIDALFSGAENKQDPTCPTSRLDFDCDSFPTSIDLGFYIDNLFSGGSPPCAPCSEL